MSSASCSWLEYLDLSYYQPPNCMQKQQDTRNGLPMSALIHSPVLQMTLPWWCPEEEAGNRKTAGCQRREREVRGHMAGKQRWQRSDGEGSQERAPGEDQKNLLRRWLFLELWVRHHQERGPTKKQEETQIRRPFPRLKVIQLLSSREIKYKCLISNVRHSFRLKA